MSELQNNQPKPTVAKDTNASKYIDLSDPGLEFAPAVSKSQVPDKAKATDATTELNSLDSDTNSGKDVQATHELELNRQNAERLRKESNKQKALSNLKALGVDSKTLESMNKSATKSDSPNNDVDGKYNQLTTKRGARREVSQVTSAHTQPSKMVNSSFDKTLKARAMQKVRDTAQAAKKAADKFARMQGVRPQSSRTMSGTHKELYIAGLVRRQSQRTGHQFWSAHIRQRADVDMRNPFAGSDIADYKLPGRNVRYHSQTLSDRSVDKILEFNNQKPFTDAQKQASLENQTYLIGYNNALPFTGNVFEESRRPGSYIVNQNTIDKPTVPMDPKKEAAAESYVNNHPELRIEHQEHARLEHQPTPAMKQAQTNFENDLANEFSGKKAQLDVSNQRRNAQLSLPGQDNHFMNNNQVTNQTSNSNITPYEPEVGDNGDELEF